MNASLKEALKEAYASAPVDSVIFETLEIRQTGVQDTVYLVKHIEGITAIDENGVSKDYQPCYFNVTLPASNEDGFRSINISIDNVDRRISDYIEMAKSAVVAVEVLYRPYLSTDLTQPQMTAPLLLFLKDVSVNTKQVVGRATFMDIVNKKFPNQLYTRERFPGLG